MEIWGLKMKKETFGGLIVYLNMCYGVKNDLTKVEGLICEYKFVEY